MFNMDKLPGVCSSILIGIAAYTNLMTMNVQAAELAPEPDEGSSPGVENLEQENEETGSHEVTEGTVTVGDEEVPCTSYESKQDYDEAVSDIIASMPEDADHTTDSTETAEGTTSITTTTDTFTWTDDNGMQHTTVVESTYTDGEDKVFTNVIPGTSYTEELPEDEKVLDHVDEEGNEYYVDSITHTVGDTVENYTNTDKTGTTIVTETVTTVVTEEVFVTDADGNRVTVIDEDAARLHAYDADGNMLVQVKDDNGKPVLPTAIYDKDGNLVADLTGEDGWTLDENGNYTYWDEANLVKYTIESKLVTTQNGDTVYVDAVTGDKTLDATTTVTTEGQKVECSKDDDYEYSEKVGSHMEACDKDDEGAIEIVTGKDIVYTPPAEGATPVRTETCGKDDEGARPVEKDDEDTQTTTVIKGLYEDDANLKEISNLLGGYGITGQEVSIKEAQTSINAGCISAVASGGSQVGTDSSVRIEDSSEKGDVMRFESVADDTGLRLKGDTSKVILGSGYADMSKEEFENEFVSVGTGHQGATLQWQSSDKACDSSYYIEKEGENLSVSDTRNEVAKKAAGLMTSDSGVTIEGNKADFTGVDEGTSEKYDVVYTQTGVTVYDNGYTVLNGFESTGSMNVYMNSNQVVVFNVDTSSLTSDSIINLNKYMVNAGGKVYWSDGADKQLITQQVIFNFGNYAGVINTASSVMGLIIAPNATFTNSSTSAGQIICNKYVDTGSGEWHYTGKYGYEETVTPSTEPAYERDVYEVDRVSYEREVDDYKYYKTEQGGAVISNTPLHAVTAKQYKYETKLEDKTVIEENTYVLNWKSPDILTSTTQGEETLTTNYNKVTPPPVEEEVTPPPVEEEVTPPPVEEEVTPPPVEEEVTPPPVEEEVTPPPVEEEETPPPVEEEETPPTVEEEVTPPPVEEEETPPTVEEEEPPTVTIEEEQTPEAEAPAPALEEEPTSDIFEEIPDDDVPLASAPVARQSDTVTLLDEDVPLAALPLSTSPKTGDYGGYGTAGGLGMSVISAMAGMATLLKRKKRK